MKNKKEPQGFTLVELMIVVVILGVLAAIAFPSFTQYLKQSRTSEAKQNLGNIYKGSLVYYYQSHYNVADSKYYLNVFPEPSVQLNPNPIPKATKVFAVWNVEPWMSLQFELNGPVYYSYFYLSTGSAITGAGANFTAQAFGDLDADNSLSTFERSGVVSANGEIVGSALIETDPLE